MTTTQSFEIGQSFTHVDGRTFTVTKVNKTCLRGKWNDGMTGVLTPAQLRDRFTENKGA